MGRRVPSLITSPQAILLCNTSSVSSDTGVLCLYRARNLVEAKKIWRSAKMVKYIPNRTDVLDALVQVETAQASLRATRRGLMSIAKNYSISSTALLHLVRAASSAAVVTAECYHLLSYMEAQGGAVTQEPAKTHSPICTTSSQSWIDAPDHVCCDFGCAWCLARPGGVATCDFHSGQVDPD